MRIKEILDKNDITLSFEMFPPKTADRIEQVDRTAGELAAMKPHFMSVTYGAGGGNFEHTLTIASAVQNKYDVPVLAHLTCVATSRDKLREMVDNYHEQGIENIMALRGDIPADGRLYDDYDHAIDLIRALKGLDPEFCIGGGCYPEKHVECATMTEDIRHLRDKVDAGCDFITTQMFFENETLYKYLYKVREAGIDVPVLAGIMPITNLKQIERSAALSGASIPGKIWAMAERYGDDPDAMKQAGIAYATEQIIDLIANGVTHIHLYAMNRPEIVSGIRENLSSIIK